MAVFAVVRVRFLFQSTLPTRGSDLPCGIPVRRGGYFNPRSPRGGATYIFPRKKRCLAISIHAPHEGERPYALLMSTIGV